MSEPVVTANEDRLTLEVTVGAKKYKYKNRIHDAEELGYLSLRFDSAKQMSTVEKFLADEFTTV